MSELDYDEWEATYKPILDQWGNPKMFETYGEDLDIVTSTYSSKVWTWVDGGDYSGYSAGIHYVNRLGYFICEVPFVDDNLYVDIYEPYPCEESDEHLWIPSKGFSEQMCEWCGIDKGEWEEDNES